MLLAEEVKGTAFVAVDMERHVLVRRRLIATGLALIHIDLVGVDAQGRGVHLCGPAASGGGAAGGRADLLLAHRALPLLLPLTPVI